jgi:4-amino-4-deoxy-L-arabinose transferase-like glycosyltransferase
LSLCLFGCLCSFLFFQRLGDRPLNSSHEARAAQNAQSILSEGDWLLPQLFDRRVELQKPPLYYWLVALAAGLRGGLVDAWAVRLPAALSALVLVVVLYAFCAVRGRPLAGFLAAAILATSLHFTWLARIGRIDMPLTLAVALTVIGFYEAPRGRFRLGWLLLAYLAAAGGVLLKGPIGLVFPAVVLLACRLLEGRTRQSWRLWLRSLGFGWGIPLVIALAGPWFVLASLETRGDFLRVFFWHHNLERGFGGDAGLASHPWGLYFARLPVDLLPWSLLAPLACWLMLRSPACRADREARLGLAWLGSILLLLLCLTFKRADYLLPAYPGAALFLGCALELWWNRWRSAEHLEARRRLTPVVVPGSFVLALVAITAGWAVYLEMQSRQYGNPPAQLAAEIRKRTAQTVVFFRVEDHELAFHVGRPIDTVLEWENLNTWLARSGPVFVVMPESCAAERARHLTAGPLEVVLRSSDLTDGATRRPLVFLKRSAEREDRQPWAGVPSPPE